MLYRKGEVKKEQSVYAGNERRVENVKAPTL
jgi:hypothetical protein